jgi:hypothetical protein
MSSLCFPFLLINIHGLCLKCAFIIPDIYRVQHESHRSVVKLIEKYLDGSPWKGEQSFGPLTVMRGGTIPKTNETREPILANMLSFLVRHVLG